jgi:hypothetical protein
MNWVIENIERLPEKLTQLIMVLNFETPAERLTHVLQRPVESAAVSGCSHQ